MWRPNEAEEVEQMERTYIAGLVRYDARAVVSQLRPGPGAPADLLPWEKLHAGNAYVADLVRRYPDRLLGYCTTHPGYPTQALAELELRLVQQRDTFACLKMHSLAFCDEFATLLGAEAGRAAGEKAVIVGLFPGNRPLPSGTTTYSQRTSHRRAGRNRHP
jgi:hypothetical protein